MSAAATLHQRNTEMLKREPWRGTMALRRAMQMTGFPLPAIVGSGRTRAIVQVRAAIVWSLRCDPPLSYPNIGRRLGHRDHTTIINLHRRANEWRAGDPAYRALCDAVAGLTTGETA